MQHVDTAIIGGGIIGLSLGYELCRRGGRPVVLERGDSPGAATPAAAGMLAPVSEAEAGIKPMLPFGLDSLRRYPAFVAALEETSGVPVGLRREGTIWVARNSDEAAELAHLAKTLALQDLIAAPLSAGELLAREPRLHPAVAGGLEVSTDLQLDPRALAQALRVAIERLGGSVRSGVDVRSVDVQADGFHLVAASASGAAGMLATQVVVAAGAWCGSGLRLPLRPLRVRPIRGQIVRLRGEVLLDHVIRTPECYLVPRSDGDLLIGSTMEEQGFDSSATAGAVHDLLRHARALLPGLYDARFVEVAVGFRPALPDHLPAIGATEVPGLFLATGHFRSGILLAPATAHYLAERMAGKPVPELAAFAPARLDFAAAQASASKDARA